MPSCLPAFPATASPYSKILLPLVSLFPSSSERHPLILCGRFPSSTRNARSIAPSNVALAWPLHRLETGTKGPPATSPSHHPVAPRPNTGNTPHPNHKCLSKAPDAPCLSTAQSAHNPASQSPSQLRLFPATACRAEPKSISTGLPSPRMTIFPGLISRCRKSASCTASQSVQNGEQYGLQL